MRAVDTLERLYRLEGDRLWRAVFAYAGDREIAAGQVFDAQVILPGSATWTTLAQGATVESTSYSPAAAGTYEFRARLRSSTGPIEVVSTGLDRRDVVEG